MCHPLNLLRAVIPERGFPSWRDFHATSKPLREVEWDGKGANILAAKLNVSLINKPERGPHRGQRQGQDDCVLVMHVLLDINVTPAYT